MLGNDQRPPKVNLDLQGQEKLSDATYKVALILALAQPQEMGPPSWVAGGHHPCSEVQFCLQMPFGFLSSSHPQFSLPIHGQS